MNRLSPRALRYLYEVDRLCSLRRAAAHLGVAPSAVSRAIAALEAELDTVLIERSRRGVRLTSTGAMVVDYYRDSRASERALLSRIQAVQGLRQGEISIALGEGFIADLISAPLRAFMAAYPQIVLTVTMAGAHDAIRQVVDDQVDFALVYAPPPDSRLHTHVATRQPLDLIVPPGHSLAGGGRAVTPAAVQDYPLGVMERGFGMHQLIDVLAYQDRLRFAPALRTNSVAVLKNFVQSGMGVAFMPQLTVEAELNRGELELVLVDHPVLATAEACIVSRRGRPLSVAAERIMTHLTEGMRFFSADAPVRLG
ncbi:LysR family transcriptional regulator [Arhodomonas sp. AD133]|uniref:LysR family transcriptional regulator n=1 Tax=Arhodomonas sp. AD133 TaxID=3415009 RepID=UPI003EC091AF